MDALWSADAAVTARDVQDALAGRELATTTVLTVLGRLERKGLVTRERSGRAHRYRATASRADHVAELMRDALDATRTGGPRWPASSAPSPTTSAPRCATSSTDLTVA